MVTFLKKSKKPVLKEIYAFNEVSNCGALFQWNLGDQYFYWRKSRSFGGGCAKQLLLYQCPKCMERIGSKTLVMQGQKGPPGLCLVRYISWGMRLILRSYVGGYKLTIIRILRLKQPGFKLESFFAVSCEKATKFGGILHFGGWIQHEALTNSTSTKSWHWSAICRYRRFWSETGWDSDYFFGVGWLYLLKRAVQILHLFFFDYRRLVKNRKNYFTSSDPHHDMFGGGCQVRVVIENMMGRMENLKTLISGFLGLVILVRWALVTMFLSWTTQTGCRIHRTYVSLIGSGEGRHTTHLLKCVLLLSTSQTDWKQSSDVLSDISFDILSDKSSDISSDILSDISSDILSDIFLTYLLTFFLTNLLTLFLTYLLTFFLTYLSTCFLTYLLTFFLTYQNQNLTSTASHKKPLCKLHIYLTPRSKSNIHDNFVPVNVIALSASDRPAKRQLSPKMQNACSSTHTHTHHMHQTAPPNSSWVQKCKKVWSATTTSHGVCKPWSQMLATAVLPPDLHRWPCSARYLSPTHALHPPKTRPKYERLQRASPALAHPPHLEQASLHMPHTTCFPPRLLPW